LVARRFAGARFAVRRFAGDLRAVAFFAVRRLAGARFVARRFAGDFLAVRRFAGDLRAVAFFAVRRFVARRFAGDFLAVRRFAGDFLAADFFTVRRFAGFRAAVFLAATRRLAGLRAVVFLATDFRAVRFFAGGTVTTFLLGWLEQDPLSVERSYLFTADLKAAPAENFTPFDAAIWTGSPVRGLRPVRAARDDCEKEPKPGSVTLSPDATAPCTASMTAFNARSASALLNPACSEMFSTSSDLFTLASECVRAPMQLNAFTRLRQALR
jgi:hypothetical protein